MNKEIRTVLRTNRTMLEASEKDLKAIFRIMFLWENRVLAETNDGFRIHKETYGQLRQRICAAAAALYAKIGATHKYIALEMENSPDWIVNCQTLLLSYVLVAMARFCIWLRLLPVKACRFWV